MASNYYNGSLRRVRTYQHLDFDAVNRAALANMPAVLHRLLPAGKQRGHEWCVGNLQGEAGSSLKINMNSGLWCDFATGERGGDLISLTAAVCHLTQVEACQELALMLGVN